MTGCLAHACCGGSRQAHGPIAVKQVRLMRFSDKKETCWLARDGSVKVSFRLFSISWPRAGE